MAVWMITKKSIACECVVIKKLSTLCFENILALDFLSPLEDVNSVFSSF